MINKKKYSKGLIIIILALLITSTFTVQAGQFHIIKGTLYVDNTVMGEGAHIKIDILTNTFYFDTFDPDINNYTFYLGGFDNDQYYGATAYFTVLYNANPYTPIDNASVKLDKNTNPAVENYILNMHINTSNFANNPPNHPSLISPENGTTISSTDSATLKVGVTDPDNDPMDVSFYDNSDDSLIGKFTDISSGSSAEILWTNLNSDTTYHWYATANDSKFETRSDTWSFITNKLENQAPKVSIIQPYRGIYLLNKKILQIFNRLTLIIGKITVIANASDEDSGIEKVEFYINAKLKCTDTTSPYTYNWTWGQFRLLHIYSIKVVAYDNEGATAQHSISVRRYL